MKSLKNKIFKHRLAIMEATDIEVESSLWSRIYKTLTHNTFSGVVHEFYKNRKTQNKDN